MLHRIRPTTGTPIPVGPDRPIWWRVLVLSGVLIAFVIAASVGYHVIEAEYSWLDAVYMTVISVSTVGLREVGDLSDAGRIWTMFVIALGLIIMAVFISSLGGIIIERRIRQVLGRRLVERKINSLAGHIIVCGYGRMGSVISDELKTAKRSVVVIDADPERIAMAERTGLFVVLGDAQEENILEAAGIKRASVLMVALTNDADNLFVTLSARQANADIHIVARAQQETSQRKLLKAGADSVVCPQTICARRMAGLILRPAVVELADMAQRGLNLEVNQLQVAAGSKLADKTLAELELPRKLGAHIVAIRHAEGQANYHPTPDMKLSVGDTLVLMGESGSSDAIERLQSETAG